MRSFAYREAMKIMVKFNPNQPCRCCVFEISTTPLVPSTVATNAHRNALAYRALTDIAKMAAEGIGNCPSDSYPFENEERMIEFILYNIPENLHKKFLMIFNEQKTA